MRLSYSSLETYNQCSLKYKYREIDKIPERKSREAIFGTLVHSTMRFIHEPGLIAPTVEQALNHFSKSWKGDVWESEVEERAAFAQGVQMIQRYYENTRIEDATIIDLESRFAIEIGNEKSGKHIVSGIIDRIDRTKDGYEIIDYKTAKKMPSQDKVDNDLQLSIYLRAFLDRYPAEWERLDHITVSLYFLRHGVKLSSKRTKEQLQALEGTFLEVIQAIEAGHFAPTLSPLCDWCSYQSICPLWKHKFKQPDISDGEAKKMIEEFLTLRSKLTTDRRRLSELQEHILTYMDQEKVERVFGGSGIVGKSVRKTYTYDEDKLRALLEPLGHWDDIIKIDGIALRSVLAALPSPVRKEADALKSVEKESLSLSVKKGTGDEEDEV